MAFVSGEPGLKMRGTGELKQLWETGNIDNQVLDRGTLRFFSGKQGNKYHH